MSSSTSSSEALLATPTPPARVVRRGRWRRPLASVLVVLALLEVVTRLWLVPASRDLATCAGFPAQARALLATAPRAWVVIGNSATRHGVDPQLLARRLGAQVGVFTADSGKITTFYWLLTHDFWQPGLTSRRVVIAYFGDQLADGEQLDVGRLARFFSAPRDWGEIFRFDLRGLDQRAELVASWLSATYAARARIKERVLDLLPHYQAVTREANQVLFAQEHRTGAADTFVTLRRLVARALQHGTRLRFVALPMRDEETLIPDEARRILAEAGMELYDLRHVDGLGPRQFDDFVHLNASGQALLTEALATELSRAP